MALDDLAPELLAIILRAVDSPRNLYRLISASPSCFRVFALLPKPVLSSVIKNAVRNDETLYHLVAVWHAPSGTKTSDEALASFLDQYFDQITAFDFPTSKEDITALCRLCNHLSFFSDMYFDTLMQRLGLGLDRQQAGHGKRKRDEYEGTPATPFQSSSSEQT